MGFPIRKSADQSSFAAPRGLSQRSTSFIASQRQGIHQTPLRHLIALIINARSRDQMSDVGCQKSEPFRPLISDIRPPDSIDRKTSLLRDRPEGARSSNAWMWIAATFGPRDFSDRSPLHDVRQHASRTPDRHGAERYGGRERLFPDEHRSLWWSQTGSNRRPPACKAGALPTELWPRQRTEVR